MLLRISHSSAQLSSLQRRSLPEAQLVHDMAAHARASEGPRPPQEPPSAQAIAASGAYVSGGASSAAAASAEPPTPRGITIVSFGYGVQSGKEFLKDAEDAFAIVDAREYLKRDPSVSVSHHENGSSKQTQSVVFGQEGVVELMQHLVDLSADEDNIGVGCRQGIHRSDTCARSLEDTLNMIVDENGHRVYNAKHFSLSSAHGRKGYQAMLSEAKKWSRKPWVTIEGGMKERRHRFGYDGCMGSEMAAKHWMEFQEWLDENWGTSPLPPPPAAQASSSALPPPPPVPPHVLEAVKREEASALGAEEDEPEHHASAAPRTPEMGPSGAKRPRALEPWETFERDASVWVDVLVGAGVDKVARQEIFLLAQHSDAGFGEANSIIAKLLKKQADQDAPRNPSAFVHAFVCSARGNIGSWNYHGGQSSSSGKKGGKASGKSKKW